MADDGRRYPGVDHDVKRPRTPCLSKGSLLFPQDDAATLFKAHVPMVIRSRVRIAMLLAGVLARDYVSCPIAP